MAGVSVLAAKVLSAGEERVTELKRLYDCGEYAAPATGVAARIIEDHEQS